MLTDRLQVYSEKAGENIVVSVNAAGQLVCEEGYNSNLSADMWKNGYWNDGGKDNWDHNRWDDHW